ncbi:MAG: ATP-binding protein [Bacteroidota bacterium]
MLPEKIKRIALIGPESSGKTTLCQQLAAHYKTLWIPEYARGYMEKLNRKYTIEDILFTVEEQLKTEERLLQKANNFLFVDTEFIIAKIWCEDVFGFCPDWISEKIEVNKYDLYLLTKPDLPWEQDAVRKNPNRRNYFYDLYLKEIETRKFNREIISGNGEERFRNALNAVEKHCSAFNNKL